MKYILISLVLFIGVFNLPTTNADEKTTGGIDHIGLSVSDLDASENFFVEALGFSISGRDPEYPAVFMSNEEMSLTLWQTSDNTVEFDRKHNVGLHHLAIKITSFEALDALYEKVQKIPNVVIEFAPELAYGGPAKHMMIREPSGNRLELVHRPSK